MKFSMMLAALVPLAMASPAILEERATTSAQVLADLKALDGKVENFNTFLNGVSKTNGPTSSQLNTLLADSNAVSTAIKKATTDANNAPQATAAQSATIYNYVNSTLAPDTIAFLQNLIAHAPGFKKQQIQSAVESQLKTQKSQTDALTTALVNKASSAYKAKGKATGAQIDAEFTKAEAAFK